MSGSCRGLRSSAGMWEPLPPLTSSQKGTEVVDCATNIVGGTRQRRLELTSKCLLNLVSSSSSQHQELRFILLPALGWRPHFAWGFHCLVQINAAYEGWALAANAEKI